MTRYLLAALVLTLAVAPTLSFADAEHMTSVDGYEIYYNALTADTLLPEVAKQYGLQRSKTRGLLNVSVRKPEKGTLGTAVPATIDAGTLTLTGHPLPIGMREIKEGDAIYYIGDFPIKHQESVTFALDVRPQGAGKSYKIKFVQQFFTD